MTGAFSGIQRVLFLAFISFFLILEACAGGRYLSTKETGSFRTEGTFDVIFYGCTYSNDAKNVAILYREGDPYPFEVNAPESAYRIRKNVPSEEALAEAEEFVRCHRSSERPLVSQIRDVNGNTIGYEVRPLYSRSAFGRPDILDVAYLVKDGKIVVMVGLKPELRDYEAPLFFRDNVRQR